MPAGPLTRKTSEMPSSEATNSTPGSTSPPPPATGGTTTAMFATFAVTAGAPIWIRTEG